MSQIDKKWFLTKLEDQKLSVRGLARQMGVDASAISRTLSGERRMQMDEARQIAQFLRVPVSDVMKHAGVSVDLDGLPTRIFLAKIIGEDGYFQRLKEPRALPQSLIEKAHDAMLRVGNGQIIAGQVRAAKGPLAMWDDAVVLFRSTETVEPAAIGVLAVCRYRDSGKLGIAKLLRARKTGEATVQQCAGDQIEVVLDAASPVLAVLP